VKVLARVGRASRRSGGRLFRRTTVPEPTTDRLDEQLSALLKGIEVELSERDRPRDAPRADPYVSTSAPARPIGRAQTASRRVDPIVWERIALIFTAVMIGILVALVVIWFQDQGIR
jgi:hypothetical protein